MRRYLSTAPISMMQMLRTSFRCYLQVLPSVFMWLMLYVVFVVSVNALHFYFANQLDHNIEHGHLELWLIITSYWALILLAFSSAAVGVWLNLVIFIKTHAVIHRSLSRPSVLFTTSLRQFLAYLVTSLILLCLVAIGLFLLVLPGIFIWVMLILAKPLVAADNLSVKAAIKQSWRLVRGHACRVLGCAFLVMFCGGLCVFLLLDGVGVIYILVDIVFVHNELGRMLILGGFFILIYGISTLLLPLYYSFLSILLHDLKLRQRLN